MVDPTDHLDPKEATEAKLCAYLENELPPAERAEIEQHLKANPQHRRLLADLAVTRDWMQNLPRESAPAELAEAFQGQMERTMLLDQPDDSGSFLSIGRWPQLAMIAAMVVLTGGLTITLILMLKGGAGTGRDFAVAPSVPAPAATQPQRQDHLAAKAKIETDAGAVGSLGAAPMPPAAALPPLADAQKAIAGALAPDPAEIMTKVASSGYRLTADQRTICLVVSSASPSATADQVQQFCTRHLLTLDQPVGLRAANVQYARSGDRRGFSNNNANAGNGNTQAGPGDEANTQNGNNSQGGNAFPGQGGQFAGQNAIAPITVPATGPVGDVVLFSRGLTPLQLELLDTSLATATPEQTVKRLKLSEGSIPRIAKGQTLIITVDQLVGPGVDKTNQVKISDDGTITLPMMTEPLAAAGATYDELEKRIAARYRDTNIIPQATVKVTGSAATQPAAAAPSAATQPAGAGIDVVVVIEKAEKAK